MMEPWLIKIASAGILPSRLVPECDPTGPIGVATSSLPTCDTCFLAQLGYNVVMALVYAAFIIVVVMAVTGGLRMFFSGGSSEKIKAAGKHITSSLLGLAIVLLSWVGLNLFFSFFTTLEGKWYILDRLDCTTTRDECIQKCEDRYVADQSAKETCQDECPSAR